MENLIFLFSVKKLFQKHLFTKFVQNSCCVTPTRSSQRAYYHCVKTVQIRSFFWSVFPIFGLHTDIWRVNLHVQSEYRKIQNRKYSVSEHFSRSVQLQQSSQSINRSAPATCYKNVISFQFFFSFFLRKRVSYLYQLYFFLRYSKLHQILIMSWGITEVYSLLIKKTQNVL